MSSDTTNAMRERRFKEFLLARLFGLVAYVEHPKNEEETYPIASGVLVEAHGYAALLTVGHYLTKLTRWREQQRLAQIALIVHSDSGFSRLVSLDLDAPSIDFSPHVDIGLVSLNGQNVEDIRKNGGKLVDTANTFNPDYVPDRFILCGLAAAQTPLVKETIAKGRKGSAEVSWQMTRPSGFAASFSWLRLEGEGDDPGTFKFSPIKGILPTYQGASGAPIFAYSPGATFADYSLFAIQSRQVRAGTGQQKPKYLIATKAALAMTLVSASLAKPPE
jgi:hypothetical protein